MNHASAPTPPRGVYLITPDEPDTARLLARTAPLLAAGATWLQYRNKTADAALRLEQATALQALCAPHGVPLIINDDPALAHAVGAAGVHLGGTDGDIGAARTLLGPDAIIGASCYDQLANAARAVAEGASYVAFGAFFPTTTKVTASRATPAGSARTMWVPSSRPAPTWWPWSAAFSPPPTRLPPSAPSSPSFRKTQDTP